MRILLLTLLISLSLLSGFGAPSEDSAGDLALGIIKVAPSGSIRVSIRNGSNKGTRIWKEANSWGAAHWRVLVIRKGQEQLFYQNPNQGFTVNFPQFKEIPPGGQIDQILDLNGGDWCGFGHCSPYNERGFGGKQVGFESGDLIIVLYDVPKIYSLGSQLDVQASDLKVWYGVLAASTTGLGR